MFLRSVFIFYDFRWKMSFLDFEMFLMIYFVHFIVRSFLCIFRFIFTSQSLQPEVIIVVLKLHWKKLFNNINFDLEWNILLKKTNHYYYLFCTILPNSFFRNTLSLHICRIRKAVSWHCKHFTFNLGLKITYILVYPAANNILKQRR